jgi:hypothetical protein
MRKPSLGRLIRKLDNNKIDLRRQVVRMGGGWIVSNGKLWYWKC